jgi:putative acetyltransferase
MPTQHRERAPGHNVSCRPAAAVVAKIMSIGALSGQSIAEGWITTHFMRPKGRTASRTRRVVDDRSRRRAIAELPAPPQISSMFTIREARPGDANALVDVWLRSVRATHTFLSEADIEFFLPLVRDLMSSDQLELWVLASDANTLIGFMGLSGNSLEAMFLDPDHLRAGHGRRLVAHARDLKGALTVDVNEQNPAALSFYEACGFTVVGRSEVDSTGRPFPLLHMRQHS